MNKNTMSVAVAMFLMGWMASAAVPNAINYQGRLLDSGGLPVTASVDIEVAAFDVESGGVALWTQTTNGIGVTEGVYDFQFGDAGLAAVLTNPAVWLEVVIEGETLVPRQRLVAVPYAVRAGVAQSAESVNYESIPGLNAQGYPDYPPPVVTALTPAEAVLGYAPFEATVTGSGFQAVSRVTIGGVTATETVVDAERIDVIVPGGLPGGAHDVRVSNLELDWGIGAGLFTVQVPMPVVSGFTPDVRGVGYAPFSATIEGESFLPGAQARVGGAALEALAVVDATTLTGTVPAGLAVGVYDVEVANAGGAWAVGAGLFAVEAWPGTLSDGLTAYYTLDQTAGASIEDASGNGRHGANVGGELGHIGKVGRAAHFSMGAGARISATGFGAGETFQTLSAWVKPSAPSAGAWQSIMSRGNTGGRHFFIGISANNRWAVSGASAATDVISGVAADDGWHLLTGVMDQGALSLYLDGVLIAGPDKNIDISSGDLGIAVLSGFGAYFDGLVDEAGVWNRALTPAEIASLYAAGAGEWRFPVPRDPWPRVTAIAPNSVPEGYAPITVTVNGEHFQVGTRVRIGATELTDVTVLSEAELTATVPAGISGGVHAVSVSNDGDEWISTSALFSVSWPPWPVALTDGLLAYYRMDGIGNVPDATGNGRDGTTYGAVGGAEGKIGTAYTFHGDYVAASGFPANRNTQTVSAWVKASSPPVVAWQAVTARGTTSPSRFFMGIAGNGHWVVSGAAPFNDVISNVPADDAWRMLTAVLDNGALSLYLDGVRIAGPAANMSIDTGAFTIGSAGTLDYFIGRVDEVGVWDRALSEAEILMLYNSGNALPY